MMDTIERTFCDLVQCVAAIPGVQSVGRSGGRALPAQPSDGDIDVFLYCDAIPTRQGREAALAALGPALEGVSVGVFGGGRWGEGDFARVQGVETWLMYFTVEAADAEVDAVLSAGQPDKEGNYFYPTGRCAMYLGMDVLYDKAGFLKGMKERLSVYPDDLVRKLAEHHLGALGNGEDLERAVLRRDALFYHFALDLAIDHFLQALFAMNRVFFPSRKRSLEYIQGFRAKPDRCQERLLEVLRLGGAPESVEESYHIFAELCNELRSLPRQTDLTIL